MNGLERRRAMMATDIVPSDAIIIAERSDNEAAIMEVVYAKKRWSKSPKYMTKGEAEAVSSIGTAFQNNTEITNLNVLEYFINATGSISFDGCTSLSAVTIPEKITTLPFNLLRNTLVKYLYISKSVTSITPGYAFQGASYMEYIEVDENNTKYHSYNGLLYESSTFTCFYCPPKITGSVIIKNGTKIIYKNLCQLKDGITSIYIPDGVETVGANAFYISYNGILTPQGILRIPSSITSLGNSFARGSGFTKVEYYSSATIPQWAFMNCMLLKTLVIYYEEGVVDLTLVPYSDGNYETNHPFRNTKLLETIYVPDSLLTAYQNSANWKLGINLTGKMRPLSELPQ